MQSLKFFRLSLLIFSTALLLNACSKDDDGTPKEILLEGIGYAEPQKTGDPYIFTDLTNGSYLKLFNNPVNDEIDSVFIYDGSKAFGIKYDENAVPVSIYTGELHYVLSNYQDNSVSVAVYNKQNEKIRDEVVTDETIAEITQSPLRSSLRNSPPCGIREGKWYIPCSRRTIWKIGRVSRAIGVGIKTQVVDKVCEDTWFAGKNADTLNDNYLQFTHDFGPNYTGSHLIEDEPPVVPPNVKGCWIVTLKISGYSVNGISVPPQSTELPPVCDVTKAELSKDLQASTDAANQEYKKAGIGAVASFEIRQQ